MQKPARVVIVDADTPIYTAASKCEAAVPFFKPGQDLYDDEGNVMGKCGENGGGPVVYEVDLEQGKATLRDIIENIRIATRADSVVCALSNYDNPWRKGIMSWYKGNRKGMRKPSALPELREFVRQNYKTYERPTLEGDDVCGILLTMPDPPFPGKRILASADKDMRTLPGSHYHMRARMEFDVSSAEADRWHMMQTLIGDITDNYHGCPGIGEKKAEKLLSQGTNVKEWWPLVVGAFHRAELTTEYALLHAQVSRICRDDNWDFKKKEVVLWQPPM
jgi:DNA polymerase I